MTTPNFQPPPPRVSLHMTVYNTEKYVAQAVRSILNQTYHDFDLVLWDDGSTDGSPEILRKLAQADRRVRVMGGTHIGILSAHTEAIKASRGELIGWVDSDDLLDPKALAETVAALDAHPEIGVVYTNHYEIDQEGKNARLGWRTTIPYSKDRLLVDFMTFHFRLIRRSAYEAAGGFDPAIPCAVEDYDLCLRLSEKTEFLYLPKPLYFYRLRPGSYTQTNRMNQIESAVEAVRRALVRRGLADQYDLTVELHAKFGILKKSSGPAGVEQLRMPIMGPEKLHSPEVSAGKSSIAATVVEDATPRVSLHMTVHNTREYVAKAVRSVLNQTYRNFDLVLWDDGSTDGSREILEELARSDARVKVLGGENAGTAAAHAQAIAASRGQYIGWVDSDDLLAPEALAETVRALDEHPEVGVAYTHYYEMGTSGTRARIGPLTKIPYSSERLLVDFMTFHFRLIRRSAYDAAGGIDPTMQAASDYDLCLRLSEKTTFLNIPKPLYYYRLRANSLSHDHRTAQITASADAVRRALVRRGLADDFELSVALQSRFRVRKKNGMPRASSLQDSIKPIT